LIPCTSYPIYVWNIYTPRPIYRLLFRATWVTFTRYPILALGTFTLLAQCYDSSLTIQIQSEHFKESLNTSLTLCGVSNTLRLYRATGGGAFRLITDSTQERAVTGAGFRLIYADTPYLSCILVLL
jgi:hypothetical protein